MSSTLLLLYAGIHLTSALFAGVLGYWSLIRTEMRSKRLFGALMMALFLWSLVAASELVSSHRVSQLILHLHLAVGLTIALLWVLFTANYTNRSIRTNPAVRVAGAAYILLLIVVLTNPFHEYYLSFRVHQAPFPHMESIPGPARTLGVIYVLMSIGLGTYYLGSLFQHERSRVSTSTAVLGGAVLLGAIPFLGSLFRFTPVPTYNHTPFGVSVFLLGVGYVVMRHRFYDLSPIARELVLDQIDDALIVLDSRSRLADYNPAATEIIPELTAEGAGTSFSDLHSELADLVAELQADQHEEISLPVNRDTRHFTVQTSDIIRNSEAIGTAVFLRDVTERRDREQQLERQNERLDQFASMVSHDLRNPLNVAWGRMEMIAEEHSGENVEAVQDALDRMVTMIDDMLRLARAGRDIETTEQCLIAALVEDAWRNVQTTDSVLDSRVEDATIDADATRLTHIFENLFRNALDHNDPPLVVRVGLLETDEGFYVEDDGDGIPEDEREAIFDHGYTTSEAGSGLGLAIVSGIIDAHGWTVTVTESDDGGARFEIRTI